jgi:4-oxalomesaconate tautomerase
MRGGTSKGLVFHAADLPADTGARDRVLLAAMGSPDLRQIDGAGGGHPLTSKVAVVSRSAHRQADIDYLFLQVVAAEARVDASQNCGNMLAAVGPFAIETGLVAADDGLTNVRIRMVNTDSFAVAAVETPGGRVNYEGDARIDGVPGAAAPIWIEFSDVAGATCGALLPSGSSVDVINGLEVTLIDNGMPVVLLRAADVGKTGYETPQELEADDALRERIEALRLEAGRLMRLGDVHAKNIPKMCLTAPPRAGGSLSTRTFIPHRVHEAIGVLGAVSVATACGVEGSVPARLAVIKQTGEGAVLDVEHPSGAFSVRLAAANQGAGKAALMRTARMLMRGEIFVPSHVWRPS